MEWAVVTGASGGIGEAFAERLAQDGSNLILVARSAEKLREVAEQLERLYRIQTQVAVVDLTDHEARANFIAELNEVEIHTLVNNAGFGSYGLFHEIPAERLSQEVTLNVVALTELSRFAVEHMLSRGKGAIINVASTAAFQPLPEMSVYAATKGYVLQLSIALWEEVRNRGVRVVAVCPGPTATNFFATSGDDSLLRYRRRPSQVVDATFDALRAHRPFVVDGTVNRVLALSNRFVPRWVSAKIARKVLHL